MPEGRSGVGPRQLSKRTLAKASSRRDTAPNSELHQGCTEGVARFSASSGYRDPTTDVLHHALRCPRFQEAPSSCSRGELSTEAWSSWWRQRVLPAGMASWLMASSSAWRALTVRHFLLQLSTRSCNWQVHAVTVSPPHMVYTSS